jgi:hypothetical protein
VRVTTCWNTASAQSDSALGRCRPDLVDADLQPGVVRGEELLAEAEAGGELAVLRPKLLILQRIGAVGVDRRIAADDDDPGSIAIGLRLTRGWALMCLTFAALGSE